MEAPSNKRSSFFLGSILLPLCQDSEVTRDIEIHHEVPMVIERLCVLGSTSNYYTCAQKPVLVPTDDVGAAKDSQILSNINT